MLTREQVGGVGCRRKYYAYIQQKKCSGTFFREDLSSTGFPLFDLSPPCGLTLLHPALNLGSCLCAISLPICQLKTGLVLLIIFIVAASSSAMRALNSGLMLLSSNFLARVAATLGSIALDSL